ncbi:hypothetical protein A176_003831 [Myxococcus hansupus]|uniref:Uncharacterized protein n=1 Tax=Pseudomyxococcus hansupus TaxID=1297742 RepID=A0A0H4WVR9_9BACT|nr:hypothetical protein A176_003831 [Myxococcus hansupus]
MQGATPTSLKDVGSPDGSGASPAKMPLTPRVSPLYFFELRRYR